VVKSTSANAPQNNKRKYGQSKNGDVSPVKKKRSRKSVRARKDIAARSKRSATAAPAANVVFHVGFMGAGKSSVGRALGQRLNWLFEDLDDRIELRERRSVPAIFRDSGEAAFRQAEHTALRQTLEELSSGAARIVALGGGAFGQKANAALLREAKAPTVFLDAPVDELYRRCSAQAAENGAERPLLKSMEQFRKLYETRRKNYSSASLKIDTGGKSVEAIADKIAKKLGLQRIALRIEQGEVE
jgi:shikimate kinase